MVSRDPKSGYKLKFSAGLIWIVLHYPKREQSLFIFGDGSQQKQTFKNIKTNFDFCNLCNCFRLECRTSTSREEARNANELCKQDRYALSKQRKENQQPFHNSTCGYTKYLLINVLTRSVN